MYGHIILESGSANCCQRGKYNPPHISISKAALEQSQTHSCTHHVWLLLCGTAQLNNGNRFFKKLSGCEGLLCMVALYRETMLILREHVCNMKLC